jgi:hypothetical protein
VLSVKAISLALLLLIPCSTWAQSQEIKKPVPPISSQAERASKSKNNPSQEQPPANNLPASINLNVTGKLHIESENGNEKADPESNDWTDPISILTGCLVAVTAFLAAVTFCLARYTKMLWGATNQLVIDTEKSTKIIERAYIKMSHRPTGLVFNIPSDEHPHKEDDPRTGKVVIEVSNLGKTPAIITYVGMDYFTLQPLEALPALPNYHMGRYEGTKMKAIMYGLDVWTPTFTLPLSAEEFTSINAETSRLYLLIYADYIDQFGVRHRAGYARRHDPKSAGNNLDLVTQRDYNYDIQRKPGQGDDWDEPI